MYIFCLVSHLIHGTVDGQNLQNESKEELITNTGTMGDQNIDIVKEREVDQGQGREVDQGHHRRREQEVLHSRLTGKEALIVNNV